MPREGPLPLSPTAKVPTPIEDLLQAPHARKAAPLHEPQKGGGIVLAERDHLLTELKVASPEGNVGQVPDGSVRVGTLGRRLASPFADDRLLREYKGCRSRHRHSGRSRAARWLSHLAGGLPHREAHVRIGVDRTQRRPGQGESVQLREIVFNHLLNLARKIPEALPALVDLPVSLKIELFGGGEIRIRVVGTEVRGRRLRISRVRP